MNTEYLKTIKIGDWVEAGIHFFLFGYGEKLSLWIAKRLGYDKCYCCERKQWLNRLTNKDYNGHCDQIKL
jgi:hypothetical protein